MGKIVKIAGDWMTESTLSDRWNEKYAAQDDEDLALMIVDRVIKSKRLKNRVVKEIARVVKRDCLIEFLEDFE